MKNLVKKVQNTAFQERLWQKGSKIVLGVSGGPDSVCLLEVMVKIASKYDLDLIIAHVNYGLRGKDSDRDEKFVKGLAKRYNLKIKVLKVKTVKAVEDNLRNIRYEFFEKVRQKNNFDLVAVAHNIDDQVETFLMRVIRGAGLKGLSAMKHKTEKIIRPLLNLSRSEILEYLKKNKQPHRTDKTNKENLFFRNKVRNQLIPYLEKNFNPQIKKTIFRSVKSIAEDADFLEKTTEKYFREKKEICVSKIFLLHPALQKRIILKIIEKAKKNLKDIDAAHVEEILKALKSTKDKRQTVVFKGLKLTRINDKLILARN
jgi:tRNA(Ile)-lysidine synthase